MFEASYINGIDVRCIQHPRNSITSVCLDYKCNQNPFICNQCMSSMNHKQKHYGHDLHVKQIIPAAEELSQAIDSSRKPIQAIYSKLNADKQNNSLMKYQEEREQHFQSIRAHIETIKFQVEEELRNIVKMFQEEIQKQKQNMFKELQRYYESYREKFEHLSRKVGPVSAITKTYKYYASKHNILLKMMADSDPNSLIRWFIDLKRTIKAGQILANDPATEYEKIKKLCTSTNDLIDQLPRIKVMQNQQQFERILNGASRDIMRQMVKFGESRIPISISRSYSAQMEGHMHHNENSRSQDVSWASKR